MWETELVCQNLRTIPIDRVTDPGDLLAFLDQVRATLIEGSTVQVVATQRE